MRSVRMSMVVLMSLCLIHTAIATEVLFDWEFNDAASGTDCVLGGRVVDSSGNGRDLYVGTDTDVPAYMDSNPEYGQGAAMNFGSGSDELLFEPNHVFPDGGAEAGSYMTIGASDSYTIESLFRIPASTSATAICCIYQLYPGSTTSSIYLRFESSTKIRFAICDTNNISKTYTVTVSTSVYDGKWHHVAGVRDVASDALIIYLDYVEVGRVTDTTTGDFTDATSKWYIGAMGASSTREFIGSIDFIKMTKDALLPAQFTQKLRLPVADNSDMTGVAIDINPPSVDLGWTPLTADPNEPNLIVSSQTVEVAWDSEFSSLVNIYTLGAAANSVTLNVGYNERYYWRVNTAGTNDGVAMDRTGLTWAFQTVEADSTVAAFWKFDNAAVGTTINGGDMLLDSSANNRHFMAIQRTGTTNASYGLPCANYGDGASWVDPATTHGLLQPGYDFGSGNVAGAAPIIPASNGSFTIEAVVKANTRTDGGSGNVLSYACTSLDDYWYGTDGSPAYYFRVNNDGKVRFTFTNYTASKTVTGTSDVRDAWHHIAAVRDTAAAVTRVYVDGVLELEGTDTTIDGTNVIPGGMLALGNFYNWSATSGTRTFNGSIDFVKMTRAALSPEEFVQSFELPTSPDPVDGATGVPTRYTLSWTPITGATITSETVEVATDIAMTSVVATLTASNHTAQLSGLSNATVYYWRVNTVGSDTNGAFSRKGTVWSLRTPICLLTAADGDLNGDCIIDLADFTIMASNWLASEYE